jgi:hypothetical protein
MSASIEILALLAVAMDFTYLQVRHPVRTFGPLALVRFITKILGLCSV